MKLTNEQIQAILDGAPEGATHIDIEGGYWVMQETQAKFWCDEFEWSYAEPQEPLHSLSDLGEMLTLRQEVERLKGQLAGHERLASRGIYYTMDELRRHDSEVATRAVEDAANTLCTTENDYYGEDAMCYKECLIDYANQLRKQDDE